jgi:hypothetical protein
MLDPTKDQLLGRIPLTSRPALQASIYGIGNVDRSSHSYILPYLWFIENNKNSFLFDDKETEMRNRVKAFETWWPGTELNGITGRSMA